MTFRSEVTWCYYRQYWTSASRESVLTGDVTSAWRNAVPKVGPVMNPRTADSGSGTRSSITTPACMFAPHSERYRPLLTAATYETD